MAGRYYILKLIVIIPGVFIFASLSGQLDNLQKPSQPGETIHLWSDRTIYCVSEKLFFSAFYQKPLQVTYQEWSTVLYAELIKWDGSKLMQSKVPIEKGFANGFMKIPLNIPSGNYYLRVYTKWMRNYSTSNYACIPLKIVNPYSAEIDKGPENYQPAGTGMPGKTIRFVEGIELSELLGSYGKREKVEFEISILDEQLPGTYCVSVAKFEGRDSLTVPLNLIENTESYAGIEFTPEIIGLSLSGKVVGAKSDDPVEGVKVNLSSVSSQFYFSNAASDQWGAFLFTLPPLEGNYELYLNNDAGVAQNVRILIDHDFCNRPVSLPYQPFFLTERERLAVREIAINAQLHDKFFAPDSSAQGLLDKNLVFYGDPNTVIYEKDFIELTDLKEFFFELLPEVSVANLQKKPYLVINGETSLEAYPPLILIDNIPVTNDEKLLQIPCRNIERIEVINKGYVVGAYKYSGIISIYTEKKNLGGMDLPENSHFLSFRFFSNSAYEFPDYPPDKDQSPVADRRNLLYWNPHLQLSVADPEKISFYTSDAPGEYIISIRGIDERDSSFIVHRESFFVK